MNGTHVGYARCSTDEQDVINQTEQLLALGTPEDRIHIDRGFSGTRHNHHISDIRATQHTHPRPQRSQRDITQCDLALQSAGIAR
ncbi:recombinase family protein [Nonomuraea jabiensis]|uniref:recombinase family protein n=1 Tax=Nonomuraea jabiensis TaxID=882448 RepID=UPI0036C97EE3